MADDIGALRQGLTNIIRGGLRFFDHVEQVLASKNATNLSGADLWALLPTFDQLRAKVLRRSFGQTATAIGQALNGSVLITESDLKGLGHNAKRMAAALRFRRYEHWGPSTLHHEDQPLGFSPAGHSEDAPLTLNEARAVLLEASDAIESLLDLASSTTSESSLPEVASEAVISVGTSATTQEQKKKRGPKPDTENHRKVAEIVSQTQGDWHADPDVLDRICEALDAAKVSRPKQWAPGRGRGTWTKKPRSWSRALEYKPRLVIQALEYRLKKAPPTS